MLRKYATFSLSLEVISPGYELQNAPFSFVAACSLLSPYQGSYRCKNSRKFHTSKKVQGTF